MAAVAEGTVDAGIYWIADTSEDERADTFVQGPGKKMGLKTASGSSNQVKNRRRVVSEPERPPVKKSGRMADTPPVNSSLQKSAAFSARSKTSPQASGASQDQDISLRLQSKSKASLKDLCSEDKRRIANLIEELARVSEEKEESVQRLRDEQETFEKKIQQLEEQNELIEQERESLKRQYRECQELLGLYQQYLSHQQEKLHQSIAQAGQSRSHSKSARGMKTSHSARVAPLDGSYSAPPTSGIEPESVLCDHLTTNGTPPCVDRPYSVQAMKQSDAEQVVMKTTPPVGRQDWEAKRRHLLLQKKQLEAERKKLQARLAEQEERLLRQNQELRQSRLHHIRLQQAESSRGALDEDPHPASSLNPPSGGEFEGGVQDLKGGVGRPVEHGDPPRATPSHGVPGGTKQDAATFPVHPPSLPPALPAVSSSHPRTPRPTKLDSSLIEILDIFSPIGETDRGRLNVTTHSSLTGRRQPHRGFLNSTISPRAQTKPSHEDLEESQILEDIFFIC